MTGTRLVVGEGRVFWEVPSLQPSRNDGQDLPWPPKRLKVPWQLQALVMGATCAHSSMAQYCSGFTGGRVGDLGARLGSESRGKGRSAHWTVRSPKPAPYTRRKQFIHLEPTLARPSCNASGKRLRSQRCGSNSMRLAALLQLLATTFHDSAAGEGFAGSLRCFVSSPPSATPLVWQCSIIVLVGRRGLSCAIGKAANRP